MKRIFPAVELRPQTPPIDKREIGDAAIPEERRIHTSPSAPPPQLGPLANERAFTSDVCEIWVKYDIAHCGREELHHFLLVLLRGMLLLFSIMTLWISTKHVLSGRACCSIDYRISIAIEAIQCANCRGWLSLNRSVVVRATLVFFAVLVNYASHFRT